MLKTIIIDLNQHYTLLFLAIHEYFERFVKSHVPYKLSLFDCGHRIEHLLAVDAVVGVGVDGEVAHAKAGEVLEEVSALRWIDMIVFESLFHDNACCRDVWPPAVEETPHVRHVRFDKPLKIMMDGKKQKGVVLLPDAEQ